MIRVITSLALILASLGAQSALLGRVPMTPGGTDYQAYYDDVLNITWLADANLGESQDFGLTRSATSPPGPGEVNTFGGMTFDTAATWLAAMNAASYLGVSDWRLPSLEEYAYNARQNHIQLAPGCCTEPFTNVWGDAYWSSTEYAGDTSMAMVFFFPLNGEFAPFIKTSIGAPVWPVRPGDIGVVPIPAVGWLLAPAFGVLIRRKVSA